MSNFQINVKGRYFDHENLNVNATKSYWWLVNIISGSGLAPSINEPLLDPMLIQIYGVVMRYYLNERLSCIRMF